MLEACYLHGGVSGARGTFPLEGSKTHLFAAMHQLGLFRSLHLTIALSDKSPTLFRILPRMLLQERSLSSISSDSDSSPRLGPGPT